LIRGWLIRAVVVVTSIGFAFILAEIVRRVSGLVQMPVEPQSVQVKKAT
jgi:hypothetical protein